MRAFWRVASEDQIRKLLNGLLEGWELYSEGQTIPDSAKLLLRQILARLGGDGGNPITPKTESVLDERVALKLLNSLMAISSGGRSSGDSISNAF